MSQIERRFWDEAWRSDPGGSRVPDLVLAEELAGLAPGRALDLGCGDGTNALALARRGWSVVGVDFAREALRLARGVATEEELDARFVLADATRWRPEGLFDLVISTFALPGGARSQALMETAAAVLAEGGVLLVAEWDRSMAERWGIAPDELPSPGQLALWLPDLDVEVAEVRRFAEMFPEGDARHHESATRVAVVRARRPHRTST